MFGGTDCDASRATGPFGTIVTGTSISDWGVARRYTIAGLALGVRHGDVAGFADTLACISGAGLRDVGISSFGSILRLSRGPGVLKALEGRKEGYAEWWLEGNMGGTDVERGISS